MTPRQAPASIRRCVVAGGAGAVGRMLTGVLMAAGADVCAVDVRDAAPVDGGEPVGGARFMLGDIAAPTPDLFAELGAADLVLLAVAEPVAVAALPQVASAMRPAALLADTVSVKTRIAEQLRAHAGGLETASLNPMFAPSLGLAGRAVAVVAERPGSRVHALVGLLAGAGARVVWLTAAEHDRLTAVTQALTHLSVLAFGLAQAELGADLGKAIAAAPPPYATMLALLARISGGTHEVYWDIQHANPYAAAARAALARSVALLAGSADAGGSVGEARFADGVRATRDWLGPASQEWAARCAELFEQSANHAR